MTAADLQRYCDPGKTPGQTIASELRKLEDALDDCINNMRDLSPADLYRRLEDLNRRAGYTLGEVADAVAALESSGGGR
jgi:restriction endonuclease Mrr